MINKNKQYSNKPQTVYFLIGFFDKIIHKILFDLREMINYQNKRERNLPMRILIAFFPKSLLNAVDNVSPIANL